VLQWARTNGCAWDEDTYWGAAHGGHLAVQQWLRASGCPWDEDACDGAAMGGHLAVLQWLHANGCPWNEDSCSYAAFDGTCLCSGGCMPMIACGIRTRAVVQLRMGT
jgi:hypothetical protein